MSARSMAAELNARQVRDAKPRAVVCQDRHQGARAVGSLGKADKQSMDFAMPTRPANYHALQVTTPLG